MAKERGSCSIALERGVCVAPPTPPTYRFPHFARTGVAPGLIPGVVHCHGAVVGAAQKDTATVDGALPTTGQGTFAGVSTAASAPKITGAGVAWLPLTDMSEFASTTSVMSDFGK
jgi:hypothetical protein